MGGPPDQFIEILLTNDPVDDLAAINAAANQGYTQIGPVLQYWNTRYLLVGGYKGQ